MSDEVAARPVRLMNVVASATESLKLDLLSIVELIHAAQPGGECLHLAQRRQERNFSSLWSLVTIKVPVSDSCTSSKSIIFMPYALVPLGEPLVFHCLPLDWNSFVPVE